MGNASEENDPKNRPEEVKFFSHSEAVHDQHYVLSDMVKTARSVGRRIASVVWKVICFPLQMSSIFQAYILIRNVFAWMCHSLY